MEKKSLFGFRLMGCLVVVRIYNLKSNFLEVDSVSKGCNQASLTEGFRKSRMCVAGSANIFSTSTILHGKTSFSNHFTSIGAHDVDTKDSISLSISDNLDETIGIVIGASTRVGNEWVVTGLVLDTSLLQFLFVLTNPSDFRMSIDDGGNNIIVDMTVSSGDHLRNGETFIFSLVGQHRSKSNVTNASNVGDVGLELRVDDNATAVINFDTNILKAKALGEGTTTNGEKNNISFQSLVVATLGSFDVNLDNTINNLSTIDLGVKLEVEALLLQSLVEVLGKLGVHTTTNGTKVLNNGDLSTKARPNGTKFETNDTTTNNNGRFESKFCDPYEYTIGCGGIDTTVD